MVAFCLSLPPPESFQHRSIFALCTLSCQDPCSGGTSEGRVAANDAQCAGDLGKIEAGDYVCGAPSVCHVEIFLALPAQLFWGAVHERLTPALAQGSARYACRRRVPNVRTPSRLHLLLHLWLLQLAFHLHTDFSGNLMILSCCESAPGGSQAQKRTHDMPAKIS